MTCKDIMTPNPSCCLPSDSVAIAAQIMRRNDVGPVLVVSDHHENRLIGIVTDRDLAIKVIADARDPHTTRVDEVMTLHPVCCHEEDETHRALELMAEHQVRRVPIVGENDRLVGIVAQADIALHEDEEDVGRMVEQISEPYGSSSWTEVRSGISSWTGGASIALGALCMGLGAGLMYVLDSARCKVSYGESTGAQSEDVSDEKLVSRIRSRVGRYLSNPRAVEVTAVNGHVTLDGPILADEVRSVIDCVNAVDGVRSLESRLDVHDYPGSHPSLRRSRADARRDRGTTLPLIAGVAAGGLLLFGMRSRTGTGAIPGETVTHPRGETPGY